MKQLGKYCTGVVDNFPYQVDFAIYLQTFLQRYRKVTKNLVARPSGGDRRLFQLLNPQLLLLFVLEMDLLDPFCGKHPAKGAPSASRLPRYF